MTVYRALVSDGCHISRTESQIGIHPLAYVIVNGGEAGVRDRTMAGSFDVVGGNADAACSGYGLGYCTAAFRVS